MIEAHGCDEESLRDVSRLQDLFHRLIEALDLHPVQPAAWHQFPGPGGVTGLCLLSESHLACHTFPEYQSLCLNVFCCRPRPERDFAALLKSGFAARRVSVRRIDRPYHPVP